MRVALVREQLDHRGISGAVRLIGLDDVTSRLAGDLRTHRVSPSADDGGVGNELHDILLWWSVQSLYCYTTIIKE